MPLSLPEASPVGEWPTLPSSGQPAPVSSVLLANQPLALPAEARPEDWPPFVNSGQPQATAAAAPVLVAVQPLELPPEALPREWPTLQNQFGNQTGLEIVQTYAPGATNLSTALYSGGSTAVGDLQAMVVLPPGRMVVTQMVCAVSALGAPAGAGIRMGIFDLNGNLVGQTAQLALPASPDIVTGTLLAPVILTGAIRYYLALWCNSNGTAFYSFGPVFVGTGPTIACRVPNVPTGPFPASISLTNKQTPSFFVAAVQ